MVWMRLCRLGRWEVAKVMRAFMCMRRVVVVEEERQDVLRPRCEGRHRQICRWSMRAGIVEAYLPGLHAALQTHGSPYHVKGAAAELRPRWRRSRILIWSIVVAVGTARVLIPLMVWM